MSYSPQQSKMIQEIEESVSCGVVAAFSEMTDSQIKQLIMAPFKEDQQEAVAN